MAQAHLLISEYGSLNFNNDWRQCEQQRREFTQRVVTGDPVTVQYGVPQGTSQTWTAVAVRQYNLTAGTSMDLASAEAATVDDHTFYNVLVNTSTAGCYRVAIEVTSAGQAVTVAESYFEVVSECPGSILFRYQNVKNKDNAVFTQPFFFRCPAKFFPQNEEYSSEDNDFRDQEYDPSLLSSEAYTAYGLTIGGPQGVPTWVGRKLNRILSCTELYLGEIGNEVQFVKASGAKIERASLGDMNPLYQFSVNLEKVIGGVDSVLIGEYTPDVEEYNNIILKLKFVKEVAEEVVFDISPSTANFQYNETAARTIYVTAADNTWSAVAGDASWLTVTKNSDGTVSITPTQNSGDANRSQQVTFTWTSPLDAIYTKTLNVAQYAQGTITGQITISGKLVDANTGAAIANVTSGQLTNLALSARDLTAPYPMSFGAVNTDSSGNFSKTFEIDSDDYANLDEFQFAVLNKVTNLFGYQDKTVTITPPAFADAVANGISFGSVALDPLPTADIVLKLKFVENEQAVTEGMIWIYGRTAVNKTLGGADYAFESGVKVDIDIDGVPIVSTTSYTDAENGSQGHIAINFVTTEDVWNNMNMLGFTLSKDGYTGSDGKLAALLPTFEQAVLDGADVGTLYLLKR